MEKADLVYAVMNQSYLNVEAPRKYANSQAA
jgi:hypothetical protein